MFLAAEAGLPANVELLRSSGGHLHAEERELARNLRRLAEEGVAMGIGSATPSGDEGEDPVYDESGRRRNGRRSPGPRERARCWELAGAP